MSAGTPPNGAGPAGPQPEGAPQMVPPAPGPYTVTVDGKQTPQGPWVVLQVSTHVGLAVYFFRPDQAQAIAALLEREATTVATGLILPPGMGGLGAPGGA